MTATTKQQKHVRVGVGVLVKDTTARNRVFAGIRRGSHGSGTLALPGGHLEMMESWEQCASREVKEEMNLSLTKIEYGHVTNDVMESEGKHYVTIFLMATCTGIPENMEPEKCEGWWSYSWEELKQIQRMQPDKLFGPLLKLIQEEPKNVIDFLNNE